MEKCIGWLRVAVSTASLVLLVPACGDTFIIVADGGGSGPSDDTMDAAVDDPECVEPTGACCAIEPTLPGCGGGGDGGEPLLEPCFSEGTLIAGDLPVTVEGTTVGAGPTKPYVGCASFEGIPIDDAPTVLFQWTAPADGRYRLEVVDPPHPDGGDPGTDHTVGIRAFAWRGCAGLEEETADRDCAHSWEPRVLNLDVAAGFEVGIAVEDLICARAGECRAGSGRDFSLRIAESPTTETQCDDLVDDDGDGLTDCADPDCPLDCVEMVCGDELDNDGDMLFDCQDPDCWLTSACLESSCSDGIDNESIYGPGTEPGDGRTDCHDAECARSTECREGGSCGDTLDNDGDGRADCADSECICDPACYTRSCPMFDIGSAVDWPVATGDLRLTNNCSLHSGSCARSEASVTVEHTYGWVAPATGTYTFDTYGSMDTTLYIMDGSCEGREIACNDVFAYPDGTYDVGANSAVTVDLTIGQEIVLVVEASIGTVGSAHGAPGRHYVLNVTVGPHGLHILTL